MTLHFYNFSGSPFGWRVHLALEHKGIPYEHIRLDPSKGEHRKEEYLTINPRGKVPAIVEGDFRLYEGAVIVEYLEDRFADAPRLFPTNAQERAQVRRLINEVDTHWWPHAWKLASNLYFRKPDDRDPKEVEAGRAGLLVELEHFESQAEKGALGTTLAAAEYALYPMLAHIPRYELRDPKLGLSNAVGPKLRSLMSRVEALACFADTYPPHWKS